VVVHRRLRSVAAPQVMDMGRLQVMDMDRHPVTDMGRHGDGADTFIDIEALFSRVAMHFIDESVSRSLFGRAIRAYARPRKQVGSV